MGVKVTPVTANCLDRYTERQHVCFGISPFNSHFSEERIQALATWGLENFERVDFFMPDGPSAFTLEALGCDPETAEWKARRQGRYLKNKIVRALSNLGMTASAADSAILNWDRLCKSESYLALHAKTVEVYEKDSVFKEACLEASRWVLEKRVADTASVTRETLISAVRYLLAEIPLFVDCASIAGASGSVFCYQQCPDFICQLLQGEFAMLPSMKQGFIIIDMDNEAVASYINGDKSAEHVDRPRDVS